ncbi:hypothetical protein ACSQ67_013232 [Phaseolus vulgaris]
MSYTVWIPYPVQGHVTPLLKQAKLLSPVFIFHVPLSFTECVHWLESKEYQPTNCRYMCHEWEIGIEADSNAKREEVEKLVNELMVGEKGKKMRERTLQLKKKTEE